MSDAGKISFNKKPTRRNVARKNPRPFLLGAALALLSAGLMICSLPAPDLGWLAWIALVPIFIACEGISALHAAGFGFLYGLAVNFAIFHWLFEVAGFGVHHYLILGIFFAFYSALWCAGIVFLKRLQSTLIFTAPSLWITLDYLRAHAGFMAFPWGTLAQAQHQNLAILQIASITGEHGVTFLVVLANTAIAGIILQRAWRTAAIVGVIIALVHLGGAYALFIERPGPTVRVAAVQPSMLLHERDTAAGRAATLSRLDRLTRVAAASHPALIAWPETAVTGNPRANPFFTAGLSELAKEVQTPIVLGVGEVEKFATRDAQGKIGRRAYNSAYVVNGDMSLQGPYLKRVLLPFGEYVPLESVIGWPVWLAPPAFNTAVGDRPIFFRISDGVVFAPLICWENLFASLARESVRGGARLLVLLANDGWFGRSAEPRQHGLASVLRAVENRVPIVVSSNTGPSQIIDRYGRIVAWSSQIFSEDVVVGEVKLGSAGTVYTRVGDLFVFVAVAGLVVTVLRVIALSVKFS
jgi:apolipoprotein N-acyltransferase